MNNRSQRMSPFILRAGTLLLALLLATQTAHADDLARTPRRLIDDLGVQIRLILEAPQPAQTPEDAERAVAEQVAALARSAPGHLALTEAGSRGRTPLMQAVSGAYPLVVQALLADPGVKLGINVPDAEGVTPWMLANFAPALTLVACQPGVLTADRYALLHPYLWRLGHLLKTKGAAIGSIVRMLQEAGAEAKPEDAKRAWLARCPNARPELREALASGALMPTLVNESITQTREFNRTWTESRSRVPASPPAGMTFVVNREESDPHTPLTDIGQTRCTRLVYPELPQLLDWRGDIALRVSAATHAGAVVVADVELVSERQPRSVVDAFRNAILRALAHFHCPGDQTFQQEFRFRFD